MRLKIILPGRILADEEIKKITAETLSGYVTLEPSHADYLAAVVPGGISYVTEEGEDFHLAADEGVMVKKGEQVLVSLKNAIKGKNIESLADTVEKEFKELDEMERKARTALEKLETRFVKGFWEMNKL